MEALNCKKWVSYPLLSVFGLGRKGREKDKRGSTRRWCLRLAAEAEGLQPAATFYGVWCGDLDQVVRASRASVLFFYKRRTVEGVL